MEALFTRSMGGLVPADDATMGWLKRVKLGKTVAAEIRQPRNQIFHKKMFALFRLAFDHWSETAPRHKYKGEDVRPDFDRFRRDITILAGKYHTTVNLKGEIRLEADSISYGSMDSETFEQLYSSVINVLLARVFTAKDWDEDTLRRIVESICEFA
jgi:hypothetical protein